MAVSPIKMPQLGESVTEGTVDKWLKQEGEFVKRDEPLVEVVTDKVNAEIPSPFEGKLVKISVSEGETVAVGIEIAQIEVEGMLEEQPAAWQPPGQPESAASAGEPGADAAAGTVGTPAAEAAPAGERPRFSPAVRRLAEDHGIDPATIQGSGEGGRVTRDDVLAAVEARSAPAEAAPEARPAPVQGREEQPPLQPHAQPPAAPAPAAVDGSREELVRLTPVRRSIAEHMVRSLATSPHAWTLQEVDVGELVRYREAQKDGFQERNGIPLTYLPLVIQSVCEALHEFPYLNSSWTEEGIVLKRYINMGVAVAIPDGLIVPVVKDADRLGITDLARRVHDLVDRARRKQLKPEDVQGGTFTLNNTGPTGSVASQPIINQPQAAILTTESIVRRPVVIGEGIAVRHMMNMCLSFDHRIVDGMMAGQFLSTVRRRLESWSPASLKI